MRDARLTLFRTPSLPRVPHLHGLVAYLASINAQLISITPVVTTGDTRSTS